MPGSVVIEIPGYRIERELGEGGMARVYVAVQESLDRPVAMKVLSADLVSDPEFCKRFLHEGKTLAKVSHPNVVRIIDCGVHEGVWLGMRPTGKALVMTAVNVDRVVDGRIVEHGGAANMMEPLMKAGAIRVADPVEG